MVGLKVVQQYELVALCSRQQGLMAVRAHGCSDLRSSGGGDCDSLDLNISGVARGSGKQWRWRHINRLVYGLSRSHRRAHFFYFYWLEARICGCLLRS